MIEVRNNLLETFEKVLTKYNGRINAKEMEFFSNQLNRWGYTFGLKRYNNRIVPVIENKGFFEDIKNTYANKHNIDLKLRPYMTV